MKILLFANASEGLYRFRKEVIYKLVKQHSVYAGAPLILRRDELENMGENYM